LILSGILGVLMGGAALAREPASDPGEICPLLPGAMVPDIVVRSADGEEIPLRRAIARGPTVLIFYRGGW